MSTEIDESTELSEALSGRSVLERAVLANLMYLTTYFEKRDLSGSHAAIFFAVERIRLSQREPRLRDIVIEVNLPTKEVRQKLVDLTDAHILSTKLPKYGDPEDVIYRIGSMGGKMLKTVLMR